MARGIDIAVHVRKLVEEKQKHVEVLGHINQTLDQISGMLGQNGGQAVRPAATTVTVPSADVAARPARKRKRRKFAVSGNELILNFVKQNKRPTTREINTHWISEGRSGKADNTLSILVNARKLKRTPLGGGEKGSRYSLA
ncbi:MAG TPA: hypothetical protein VK797_03280 [Tepidisphaeraceae bacterium]|jgi:hypothetical protein|nr:hypothetical protein [Tepidisphaeraceae bacterium]